MTTTFVIATVLSLLALGTARADTLAKIKETGAVSMGVRDVAWGSFISGNLMQAGRLSYELSRGKYAGFHVELCERVLADLQKGLGLPKLDIKYQPVEGQSSATLLLQNGSVDIVCSDATNEAEMHKDIAFAVTTFASEVRFAVKANSGITSIVQLDGKRIAFELFFPIHQLRQHERAAGIKFFEVDASNEVTGFRWFEIDRADAVVENDQILASRIALSERPHDYRIVGEALSVKPKAIMLRKDDPKFKKAVDDSLIAMMRSGEIAKVYEKWFMQPTPPNYFRMGLPASEATKAAWASPNDKPVEEYQKK